MADDPFANFKPPGSDDPFANYKPPNNSVGNMLLNVSVAPKDAPLGQTAFWNKPSDVSWGQYAGAHLQPIDDMVRHATNVFGAGDWVASKMDQLTGTGPGISELVKAQAAGQPTDALSMERARSAAADARMPEQNKLAADVLGYYPVAAEGIGTKIADTAAPYLAKLPLTGAGKWLGGVIGGGTEGIGATEAGSYGRTGQGASTGQLLLGAAQGLPGGVASRGGNAVPPIDEATLEAAHEATRAPMKAVQFNPKTVNGALDASKAALTGPERGSLSPEMNTVFNNFKTEIASGSASADDLNGYARKIFSAAKNDSDYRLAGKVRDALNNDIMARTMPTSNHSLGEAAGMNADANQAFARLKDSQWLSGTDVSKAPSEAAARLADPTKLYGPNERDALEALAKFAPKGRAQTTPTSPGAGAWQGAKDAATGVASDKLVPGAVGWMLDGLLGGLGGIGTSLAIKSGLGAYKGARNADVLRAMKAAHAALTTGQRLSPSDYINPATIRPAVRQGVTGILAAGGP